MKHLVAKAAALVAVMTLACGCSSGDPLSRADAGASAGGSATAGVDATPATGSPGGAMTGGSPAASPGPAKTGSAGVASSATPTATAKAAPRSDGRAHRSQATVLNSLPGSSSPACAMVGTRRDVRAGDVAAGNFVAARKQYRQLAARRGTPKVFLYVIPTQSRAMHGVAVTMRHLEGVADTHVTRTTAVEPAGHWRYYPVELLVPESGRWRISVVSGNDRGCFEVDFAG